MDLSAYSAYLSRFHLSETDYEASIAGVLALERWLEPYGATLDTVSVRTLRAYLRRLIRRDENSFEELFHLVYYFEYSSRVDLDLYLTDVVRGALNLDDIYERYGKLFGYDAVYDLERCVPQPPPGTDPMRLPQYTARLVRHLLAELPEQDVLRVLVDDNELLPSVLYEKERALYDAAYSLDDYLSGIAQLKLLGFRALRSRDFKWKEVCISEEYIRRVEAFPELISGVRRGNRLYVTLEPFVPEYYLRARTLEQKRYYACSCSNIRCSFLVGKPALSVLWCERCVNRCRMEYEYLLGRPLSAELVESALLGDTSCRISILLEPDATQRPYELHE